MKNLLLVLVLVVIKASCAGTPTQTRQENEIAVLERAEEFIGALYHQDFGKWWDMMMPTARNREVSGADSREEYAQVWKKASEHIKMTDYDSAKIVAMGDKYAVTQAEVSYDIDRGGQMEHVKDCEKTIWLKIPTEFLGRLKHGQETTPRGGWYWQQTGFDCDYMPSAQEIEQLTRNLK